MPHREVPACCVAAFVSYERPSLGSVQILRVGSKRAFQGIFLVFHWAVVLEQRLHAQPYCPKTLSLILITSSTIKTCWCVTNSVAVPCSRCLRLRRRSRRRLLAIESNRARSAGPVGGIRGSGRNRPAKPRGSVSGVPSAPPLAGPALHAMTPKGGNAKGLSYVRTQAAPTLSFASLTPPSVACPR